jgi:peptidoglycan/LPS O-acetylase OafA/YrhL
MPREVTSLTGLRALAIAIIAIHLLATAGVLPPEFGGSYDQVGLMIGTVLSGFLLAWHHAHDPFNTARVREYLGGRAWRILPGYFGVLILAIVVARWWEAWPYRFDSVPDFVRAALLVQAPGTLWIIPVLAQCWVLFLVVWWLWSRGAHWTWIIVLAIVAATPAFWGWGTVDQAAVNVVAPYFLVGVGMGLAWPRHLEPTLRRNAGTVALVGAVVFVLVVANLPVVRVAHGWSLGTTVVGSTWLDPITGLLVIAVVAVSAAQATSLVVLQSRPAQFIGRHAYALYLLLPIVIATVS